MRTCFLNIFMCSYSPCSFQRFLAVDAHLNLAHPFHFPSVLSKGSPESNDQVLHEAQENARKAYGFFFGGSVQQGSQYISWFEMFVYVRYPP